MDLGISGRTALVCASSDGLGFACAKSLAEAGARIILNGRDPSKLAKRVEDLRREFDGEVLAVVADVGTEAGRSQLLAAAGEVDILVNNNGGPSPKPWRELDREAIVAGIDANMWAAIAMIQAVLDGMVERRFGRIVNITSAAVKMTMPGLELSTAARSGLTGFVAGISRDVASANVTLNNLLPGAFETARMEALAERIAAQKGLIAADVAAAQAKQIPAGRLGNPAEFGATCAFLCSAHAGYMTGQNVLIDGGAYPGVN
ncbi:SDR family oxidoreductase [Novosphingobium sp. ZN18A2]|uniref:SDR family oxidoreductase n=1 Tax=Novosphingobium sp. ZN18A2 TaxID=3079861 RepID=UPI0030CBFBF6